jgi:preprotein translocase SecE subunit
MSKDDATWLNVAYVAFLLLMAYVAYKALELTGIQMGWVERYEWYEYAATAIGALVGIGLTWYLRADKERHEYFLSAIGELRKVSWPTWPDTKRMTIVVCIVVAIFAVIVGIFDAGWAWALKHLLA